MVDSHEVALATTDAQIEALVKSVLHSVQNAESGRTTYLRSLVLNTQSELGAKPRVRSSGKIPKLTPDEIEGQLAALNKVNARFYEHVVKVASADVPAGKTQALEINRRTNFARSAVSTVRGWIKDGNDITAVAAVRVTKAQLAVRAGPRKTRQPNAKRLKAAAERQSKGLIKTLLTLAETDKEAALAELNILMGVIGDQILSMGVHATRDAAEAARTQRPLRIKGTMFMPTQTQVQVQPS